MEVKRFVFTIDERKRNGDVSGTIYRIENNYPEYVTEFKFRLGSCRGEISEAFNALMNCGEIPKEYFNSSICAWRGAGYFAGEVTKHYDIIRLGRY